MPNTTIDQIISNSKPPIDFVKGVSGTLVAGRHHSYYLIGGIPAAPAAPSVGFAGSPLGMSSSPTGFLPLRSPSTASYVSELARFQAQAGQSGTLLLCDRLWHATGYGIANVASQVSGSKILLSKATNPMQIYTSGSEMPFLTGHIVNIQGHTGTTPAISGSYVATVLSASVISIPVNCSVAGGNTGTVGMCFPARDADKSIAGNGVQLGVEVLTQTGAGTPTLTVGYTDNLGVAQVGAVNTVPTVATSIIGTFHPIGMIGNGSGVQTVQTLQLSATWTSGTIALVAYRVLARLELSSSLTNAIDALTSGNPEIPPDACLFFIFIPSTTTTTNIAGHVIVTQG